MMMYMHHLMLWFFFVNDTATTEIYTLSLHDALPISGFPVQQSRFRRDVRCEAGARRDRHVAPGRDRREAARRVDERSEEHTSELQSQSNIVCRLLLEKKQTDLTIFPPPRTHVVALTV